MGRCCSDCDQWCSNRSFSRNQWLKGDGYSRCKDCVAGYSPPTYQCGDCYREFNSQNELKMHMQVHRPRTVSCPVCGEQRFKSGANAVQHVESGYCTGCRGSQRAREEIYKFASTKRAMRPHMTNVPLLENGRRQAGVPDFPYHCQQCTKQFRHLSQLLQHQDQKHNSQRLLSY